jgi:flagellum-specific peptidoglycan hydrolase FlgJ
MQLSELFVSHKQVDPVIFDREEPSLPQPIYLNLDRAKRATESEDVKEYSTTPSTNSSSTTSWRVSNYEDRPQESSPSATTSTVRWTSPYSNRNKWVADMTAAYKKAGLNDNAIKNLIAKNALESGWGKSAQGDFNFGNITAGRSWKGRTIQGGDRNAAGQPITQQFRAYDSLDGYVADEIQFLKNLYDFNQDDDFDTFIGKLQGNNKGKRRYAEDLQYASKVKGVYNSI